MARDEVVLSPPEGRGVDSSLPLIRGGRILLCHYFRDGTQNVGGRASFRLSSGIDPPYEPLAFVLAGLGPFCKEVIWSPEKGFSFGLIQIWDIYSNCDGWIHNVEHWWCALLGGVLLAFPPIHKVTSTVVGPRRVSLTAKGCNNDAFAPHSAPLALTATITLDRQRGLSSLSVWVDSSL